MRKGKSEKGKELDRDRMRGQKSERGTEQERDRVNEMRGKVRKRERETE